MSTDSSARSTSRERKPRRSIGMAAPAPPDMPVPVQALQPRDMARRYPCSRRVRTEALRALFDAEYSVYPAPPK